MESSANAANGRASSAASVPPAPASSAALRVRSVVMKASAIVAALYGARRLFTSERGEIEAARRRDGGIALMLRNLKDPMEWLPA